MWRFLWTLAVLIVSVRSDFSKLEEFERKHCYLDKNLKTTSSYFPYDVNDGDEVLDGYVCENFTLTKSDLENDFYFATGGNRNIFLKNCEIEYLNNVLVSKFIHIRGLYFDNCKIRLKNVDVDHKTKYNSYPYPYKYFLELGFHNCEIFDNLKSTAWHQFSNLRQVFIQNSTFQYPRLDEHFFRKDHFLNDIFIDNTNIKSIHSGLLPRFKGSYLTYTSSALEEVDSLFHHWNGSILHTVSFANNSLTTLPSIATLEKVRKSESLNLSGNKITELTLKGYYFGVLFYVKNIDLSRNANITAISYLAFENTHLQNLNMSSVNLESLEKLGNRNLITIDFSHNKISNIGTDVFDDLSELRHLNMSHNRISKLDSAVFNDLESLTDLRLNSNQLEELQKDIFERLKNLQFLDLSNNAIKKIHGFMYQLPIEQFVLRNKSLTISPSPHAIPNSLIPIEFVLDNSFKTNDANIIFHGLLTMQIFLFTYIIF